MWQQWSRLGQTLGCGSDEFIPCSEYDLSSPSQASWTTHRDWRRRAIRQLYEERQISSVEYPHLLRSINACARAMETTNQPPFSDYSMPQHAIDTEPLPDCCSTAAHVIKELQRTREYSPFIFQFGVVGNYQPPVDFAEYDADNLYEFQPSNEYDQSPPPHATWIEQRDWRRRALRQLLC